MEKKVTTHTTMTDGFNDDYSTNRGITEMLKKVSITAAIAGAAIITAFNGGSASASFGDPAPLIEEQVMAKESLASLYQNMTVSAGDDNDKPVEQVKAAIPVVGPGDPNEETGPAITPVGGQIKISPSGSLASLYRDFTVGAGDPNDEPEVAPEASLPVIGPGDPCDITGCPDGDRFYIVGRAALPNVSAGDDADKPRSPQVGYDYSNLVIGPGDPNEETGPPVTPIGGGTKEQAAPAPATLPNVSAGDDNDKPNAPVNAALPVVGPGDPNEESGPQVTPEGGANKPIPAPFPRNLPNVSAGDDADKPTISHVENADYTNFIVGPGDPRDEG